MPLPHLQVLDSFKRAPENPLSNGGKWEQLGEVAGGGKIEGEKFVGEPTINEGAFWTPEEFTEQAVAASVYGVEAGLKGTLRFYNCLQPGAGSEGVGSYVLVVLGGAAGEVTLRLFEGGVGELGSGAFIHGAKDGDGVASFVRAGKVSIWYKPGTEAWEEVLSVTNSKYNKGRVALASYASSNGGFTNFSISKEKSNEEFFASLSFSGKLTPHKEEAAEHTNVLGMIVG